MDCSTVTLCTCSLSNLRDVWLFSLFSCFVEISELNAKSVYPDLTARSAVSDLGLHYLPMSYL